jgi:hypothetical protein
MPSRLTESPVSGAKMPSAGAFGVGDMTVLRELVAVAGADLGESTRIITSACTVQILNRTIDAWNVTTPPLCCSHRSTK